MKQVTLHPFNAITVNNLRLELRKNPKQKTTVHGDVITLSKLRFNSDAYENGCLSLHQFKDFEMLIKCSDGDAVIVYDNDKFMFIEDSGHQELSKYEFILDDSDEEQTAVPKAQVHLRAKSRKPFKFR